jgi:hypothetical protein
VAVVRSLVFTVVLLIIVFCCSGLAFLFTLPLLFGLIVRVSTVGSLSRAGLLVVDFDALLSPIVPPTREFSRLLLLDVDCFFVRDFEVACSPIEPPIPLPMLLLLLRPAAGCLAAFGGGVLSGLITFPIRESARSLELIRLFELSAGCFATLEGGVLSELFTLSIIDLLRLVELVFDCLLILDVEVDCWPITLPMLQLLLKFIRLFELAAGCLATVGGVVLDVPNILSMREFIRFVELFVGWLWTVIVDNDCEPIGFPMRELMFELIRLFELTAGCLVAVEDRVFDLLVEFNGCSDLMELERVELLVFMLIMVGLRVFWLVVVLGGVALLVVTFVELLLRWLILGVLTGLLRFVELELLDLARDWLDRELEGVLLRLLPALDDCWVLGAGAGFGACCFAWADPLDFRLLFWAFFA